MLTCVSPASNFDSPHRDDHLEEVGRQVPAGAPGPFGILEVKQKQLNIIYGTSKETSDFFVDAFELWWSKRQGVYQHIKRLQIDLDNGPEIKSHRTQFIKRIVEFSDKTGLEIELVYYPPYHSKYNSVEHCWGVLEKHWNGTLLSDRETLLRWSESMRWDGVMPNVWLHDQEYFRHVRLTKKELRPYENRLERASIIGDWSIKVKPEKN